MSEDAAATKPFNSEAQASSRSEMRSKMLREQAAEEQMPDVDFNHPLMSARMSHPELNEYHSITDGRASSVNL